MNDIMPLKPVRRSYSADFKAELVKASQQPGVSLAGLALRHGLNANLLRRWVREHEREGKHLATQSDTAMPFVAVSLPAPVSSHSCQLQMQGIMCPASSAFSVISVASGSAGNARH